MEDKPATAPKIGSDEWWEEMKKIEMPSGLLAVGDDWMKQLGIKSRSQARRFLERMKKTSKK